MTLMTLKAACDDTRRRTAAHAKTDKIVAFARENKGSDQI